MAAAPVTAAVAIPACCCHDIGCGAGAGAGGDGVGIGAGAGVEDAGIGAGDGDGDWENKPPREVGHFNGCVLASCGSWYWEATKPIKKGNARMLEYIMVLPVLKAQLVSSEASSLS